MSSPNKENVKRKSGVGAFLGGSFLGFILGIAAVVGLCVFAYFNVSVSWINSHFNTNIDVGNEDINKLTLNVAVSHAVNLLNNTDSYTLNNLKSDFGIEIPNEIMGIDISSLKSVPLTELATKAQALIGNVSADELKEVVDLTSMEDILSTEKTYYYNSTNSLLYEDADYTIEALSTDIYEYDSANSVIILKGKTYPLIESGAQSTISVELKYLPLSEAISSFTNDLGENLTFADLSNYGIVLPDYILQGNEDKTLSEIQQVIDNVRVASILGYNYDTVSGKVYYSDGTPVEGVLGAIAKYKISELNEDTINNLTVNDLFGDTSGALGLIDGNTTINQIPTALSEKIKTSTVGELVENGLVEIENYDNVKNETFTINGETITFESLTLQDMFKLFVDNITIISSASDVQG